MTSFDSLQLDDDQDIDDQVDNLLQSMPSVKSSSSGFRPLIIAIITILLFALLNSGFIQSKLSKVPHYQYSVYGIIFSLILLTLLLL